MSERYGIIYKITNLVNNKVYIGQTTKREGFEGRYHGNIAKYSNTYLKRSIEKYGIDNFVIDKEFYIAYSKEELNQKEKYYIKFFKSNDYKYGYNIKSGGDNIGKIEGKYKTDILIREGSPIYCVNTCEIFLSITDASNKYNIGRHAIANQCKGNTYKEATFYNNELNQYIIFEYYDIHNNNNTKKIPIICTTTKERFKSINDASKYFDINHQTINNILKKNKNNYSKKHKLGFMYLYDYVLKNYRGMETLDDTYLKNPVFKRV